MDFKQELTHKINKVLVKNNWDNVNFIIEIPKDLGHGDFACNVALMLARSLRKAPREVAQLIINDIDMEYIEKIEIAGPGFLNFTTKKDDLNQIINTIIQEKEQFGRHQVQNPDNINLEYISANPTGNLHLGHARNGSYGDSLANILEFVGHKVTHEYYINDAGAQIQKLGLSVLIRYQQLLDVPINLPEDSYHGDEIISCAEKLLKASGEIYKHTDINFETNRIADPIMEKEIGDFSKTFMLERIKKTVRNMGIKMQVWSSESYFYESGALNETLASLSPFTYEKDGALWLNSSSQGDDKDRVLKKSNGYFTYLAPDIAYHHNKLNRGFNRLIDVWGADHYGYIKRMESGLAMLGLPKERFEVSIIQMAKLIKDGKEFKMSKRSGKSLTIDQLLKWIGKDALRYYMVSSGVGTHLEIDVDIAKKQSSENPVFYIQYAHARIHQLLSGNEFPQDESVNLLTNEKEVELIKHLWKFKEIVLNASITLEPHKITNYVYDLAKLFHSFYNSNKVLIEDNPTLTAQRIRLVKAVQIIIKSSLNLVGVSAPDHM